MSIDGPWAVWRAFTKQATTPAEIATMSWGSWAETTRHGSEAAEGVVDHDPGGNLLIQVVEPHAPACALE